MAYLAISNDPWWTLTGTASGQILNIRASPFQLLIESVTLAQAPPFTALMGTVTSILLFNSAMLLLVAAFRPSEGWGPQAKSLAFTSLAIALLMLTTLVHIARLAVSSGTGLNMPLRETLVIPGYGSMTAGFTLQFYLGLTTLIIVASSSLRSTFHNPIPYLVSSPLTRGLKEVAFTPLVPHQPFSRRIAPLLQTSHAATPTITGSAGLEVPKPAEPTVQPEARFVEKPTTSTPPTTRQERSILKAAIAIIRGYEEPVPYKQLLNDAYMDLVDRNVEFKSARQIETTLLSHVGHELTIIEDQQPRDSNQVQKKWWLGGKNLAKGKGQIMDAWDRITETVRPRFSRIYNSMKGQQRERYRARKPTEDEDD